MDKNVVEFTSCILPKRLLNFTHEITRINPKNYHKLCKFVYDEYYSREGVAA